MKKFSQYIQKRGRPKNNGIRLRTGGMESTMRFNQTEVESDYVPSDEL